MNKDQIKGKVTEITGRIERQAGKLTGNRKTQLAGMRKQAKGKIQKAWGNVKSSVK
jgi:uncharacterized protein YjbJ (UPF0337 family)